MKWPVQRDDGDGEPTHGSYFSLLSTQEEDGGEQLTPLGHPRARDIRPSPGTSIAANSYTEARHDNITNSSILMESYVYDQDFAGGTRIEEKAIYLELLWILQSRLRF